MEQFLKKHWYIVVLTALGIAGGYMYWKFIGCAGGSCPITSHWHSSSLAGGIMGYLSGSIISDLRNKPGK
jgi:hypothetical protein